MSLCHQNSEFDDIRTTCNSDDNSKCDHSFLDMKLRLLLKYFILFFYQQEKINCFVEEFKKVCAIIGLFVL